VRLSRGRRDALPDWDPQHCQRVLRCHLAPCPRTRALAWRHSAFYLLFNRGVQCQDTCAEGFSVTFQIASSGLSGASGVPPPGLVYLALRSVRLLVSTAHLAQQIRIGGLLHERSQVCSSMTTCEAARPLRRLWGARRLRYRPTYTITRDVTPAQRAPTPTLHLLERTISLTSLHLGRTILQTLARTVGDSRRCTRGKNRGSGRGAEARAVTRKELRVASSHTGRGCV
jgi:hypothetical protein